jgi:hypothetical protein
MALNYQMGIGHDRFDAGLGAWASERRISEHNHRRFYRRWAEMMAGKGWDELRPAHAQAADD